MSLVSPLFELLLALPFLRMTVDDRCLVIRIFGLRCKAKVCQGHVVPLLPGDTLEAAAVTLPIEVQLLLVARQGIGLGDELSNGLLFSLVLPQLVGLVLLDSLLEVHLQLLVGCYLLDFLSEPLKALLGDLVLSFTWRKRERLPLLVLCLLEYIDLLLSFSSLASPCSISELSKGPASCLSNLGETWLQASVSDLAFDPDLSLLAADIV